MIEYATLEDNLAQAHVYITNAIVFLQRESYEPFLLYPRRSKKSLVRQDWYEKILCMKENIELLIRRQNMEPSGEPATADSRRFVPSGFNNLKARQIIFARLGIGFYLLAGLASLFSAIVMGFFLGA